MGKRNEKSKITHKKQKQINLNRNNLEDPRDNEAVFEPHWSEAKVHEALKMGDVVKALFRVNIHNKLEAYCKTDGMPNDILIRGTLFQNRAVEGDIVAVQIDDSPLPEKTGRPTGNGKNLATVLANCKGKGKLEADYEEDPDHSSTRYQISPVDGVAKYVLIGEVMCPNRAVDDGDMVGVDIDAVEQISERPTGRVVAIVEKSPLRKHILGYIEDTYCSCCKITSEGVKESCNPCCKRTSEGVKESCNPQYMLLKPIDTKFPSIIILISGLPKILERLKSNYETLAMDLVGVEIHNWTEESPLPEGSVLRTFARDGEIQPQLDAIVFNHGFAPSSDLYNKKVSRNDDIWKLPLKEIQGRKDLRDYCVVSIGPGLASALSIEQLSSPGTYRIGIHISDVSHVVKANQTSDKAAQKRSTSVYISPRKLPMLPPFVSENMASLIPGKDRPTVSILLDITDVGVVLDRWVGRTVIQSCCELSQDINHAKDQPKVHGRFQWADVITSVNKLHEISNVLKQKRFSDGALWLIEPKVVFKFDENGLPIDMKLSERKESNLFVEEFMILANKTVAEIICRAYPENALLQRQPEPNIQNLEEFLAKHGLELDMSSSGRFNRSLEQLKENLKGDPMLYDIINLYASKAMQLASYFCSGDLEEHEWSHYSLGVPFYTTFTSPLDQYADIVVQQTLLAAVDAEESYMKHACEVNKEVGKMQQKKIFTGINFDKDAVNSAEVPDKRDIAAIAAYCNERNLACRKVQDECDKLYLLFLLKKKQVLFSDARVLRLGPKDMTIYVERLAYVGRIWYDGVGGLEVVWLPKTSRVIIDRDFDYRHPRPGSPDDGRRSLERVVYLLDPADQDDVHLHPTSDDQDDVHLHPAVFPLVLGLRSDILVAISAAGVQLCVTSYHGATVHLPE